MLDKINQVVIVGGGHAGGIAATALRKEGFEGDITLLGNEGFVPYQRPPLSKAFLKTDLDISRLQLRGQDAYDNANITTRLNVCVTAINVKEGSVRLEDGENISYDRLILATGSRNRRYEGEGADLAGMHYLRSFKEAEKLKANMAVAKSIVIVGGGYIGLEVGASARTLGLSVAIVEREDRLLQRVASPALSAFIENYHQNKGVEIIKHDLVEKIIGDGAGRVKAVLLASGRRLDCDIVLVGIGAVACDDLAQAAGLKCDNGIVVDGNAKTSDSAIYAIGDVTNRPLSHYEGRHIRLESVPNAIEQARQAAADIMGAPVPAPELPWFWSDQYDLKLQIAGLLFDVDKTLVIGSMEEGKFILYHLSGKKLVAVEAINSIRDFMAARKLVATADVDIAALGGTIIEHNKREVRE